MQLYFIENNHVFLLNEESVSVLLPGIVLSFYNSPHLPIATPLKTSPLGIHIHIIALVLLYIGAIYQ